MFARPPLVKIDVLPLQMIDDAAGDPLATSWADRRFRFALAASPVALERGIGSTLILR